MAGTLVKSVRIDLGLTGDAASKAKLEAITAEADKLKKSFPEYELKISAAAAQAKLQVFRASIKTARDEAEKPIEPQLTDAKALAKLAEIRAKAEELRARFPEFTVKINTAEAKAKLLVFDEEARRILGGGGGGVLSRIGGLFGGGGGGGGILTGILGAGGSTAGVLGPASGGGGGGLAAGAAAVLGAAAATGAAGIIPALAAATLGVASFGALAIPTFTAVTGAVSALKTHTAAYDAATTAAAKSTALAKIKADWAALDPAQAQAVKGIQALGATFSSLAAKLEPVTMKVFNDGLKLANTLLPYLLPLAQAAGKAIDGLLKGFEKFTQSPGFKAFMAEMTSLAGPAITAIGEGFGKIVVALGKLVEAMINPNGIRYLKVILEGVALWIRGLTAVFTWATPRITENIHLWASRFDVVRHNIAAYTHNISDYIDAVRVTMVNVGHALEAAANWIVRTFDSWRHGIAAQVDGVVGFFAALPGRILAALGRIGGLLWNAGRALLQGFWDGIKNIWDGVAGWFKGLPHQILSALGIASPPAWAVDAGKHIMGGILRGLAHGAADVAGFFRGLASDAGGVFKGIWRNVTGGGDVGSWIVRALTLANEPLNWLPAMQQLVSRESGGNPAAVNPTAVLGQHATGIAQMLPSTFAAWDEPGHTDIFNPIDNLIASVRYIRAVYGSPFNIPGLFGGTYLGYDQGGWLPPGISLAVNRTGRPERILPPGRGGGGDIHITVNAPNYVGPLDSLVRAIEDAKRQGRLTGLLR